MLTRYWLGSLLLCAWGCSAPASEEHTAAARGSVAGAQDAGGLFSGVVGVVTRKGEFVARCTGALVAPNLMLTARHCVAFDDGDLVTCGQASLGASVTPADVLVTALYTQSDTPSDYVAAAEIITAPGGDDTCGFDFAAVRLVGAPPGETATYAPRLDSAVAEGELFTAVGYGTTGSAGVGTRRYLEGARAACVAECPIPEVQANEWLAEDGAFCRADSGAAAIDAQGQLIGTVSRGQGTCSTPILAAMPPWQDWLVEVARQAASAGGYDTPDWAAEPIEPPVVVPTEPMEKAEPRLESTCSLAAPVSDARGLFWFSVVLVVGRGRRRERARVGRRC